jgi:hypothetical protein
VTKIFKKMKPLPQRIARSAVVFMLLVAALPQK